MFLLWMLLLALYLAAKLFSVLATRFPPSFWVNVAITMLILLGSAVQDSANGKDVYQAFAVRMGLFIVVAIYAGLAVSLLERLRDKRRMPKRTLILAPQIEPPRC
jgi:nitrate reductase gamma subunit